MRLLQREEKRGIKNFLKINTYFQIFTHNGFSQVITIKCNNPRLTVHYNV